MDEGFKNFDTKKVQLFVIVIAVFIGLFYIIYKKAQKDYAVESGEWCNFHDCGQYLDNYI